MKYLIILMSLFIVSCSFKSEKKDNNKQTTVNELKPEELKKLDSDGDMINDHEEEERGLDRFVANLPKMKVNFLQDYSIKVLFEDETQFSINTKTARDNPDFKYRVGNLFLRENSLKNAAKLGRFSGISWGDIKQEDFSWVKYPDVDKEYYFIKTKEYIQANKSRKIKEISISLENTLKLLESKAFNSIEQLELNFYYYSFTKEAYVSLHTEKVERVFLTGVREDFQINIINPPEELLNDSYFRHGKFIVSEVKDFYIPDLKVKYSTLLASIKNKTLPIYKTTPFENSLNYVAISEDGDSFINLLEKLYSDKFSVQEDKLVQVEQFINNLPDFEYLHELNGNDKNGNWFVMTNKIKQTYLKHKFTKADSITISYITGDELSKQEEEKVYSLSNGIYSSESSKLLPLGNVGNNSQIDTTIFLGSLKGVRLLSKTGEFRFAPPRCRNCTGTNWHVHGKFKTNSFESFTRPWNLTSLGELDGSISLLINNTEFSLNDLIVQNLARVELKGDGSSKYIQLSIPDLSKLDVIISGQENIAFLKIRAISQGSAGEGLEMTSVTGKNINPLVHATNICLQEAYKRKVKISTTGWRFNEWQMNVPWGRPAPDGWKPVRGNNQKYWTGIVVDIISTITNNYN